MKAVSIVLIIISAILLVVAIISRLLVQPIPIAAGIESQAIGQLVSILLLFAIAINTSK